MVVLRDGGVEGSGLRDAATAVGSADPPVRGRRGGPPWRGVRLVWSAQLGVDLVRHVLEEPVRQIANNAGFEGSVVVQRVIQGKDSFGFNAEKGEYEDLMKAGVIDPTKVARYALQNAASVASLLMTTEAMVAEKPEKKKPSAPAMSPEDMY